MEDVTQVQALLAGQPISLAQFSDSPAESLGDSTSIFNAAQMAIMGASKDSQAATCIFLAEHWLNEHPDDYWAACEYAEMLYMLTRYDEAVKVCLAYNDRCQEHRWGVFNQLGNLYRYRGSLVEAEQWSVIYTQLYHCFGPKASQAVAKSVMRRSPTHKGCGPGGASVVRLL